MCYIRTTIFFFFIIIQSDRDTSGLIACHHMLPVLQGAEDLFLQLSVDPTLLFSGAGRSDSLAGDGWSTVIGLVCASQADVLWSW